MLQLPDPGFVMNITSNSTPYIVLQGEILSKVNRTHSCICPIIIVQSGDCYDFSTCTCISDTLLKQSLNACKISSQLLYSMYNISISNMTLTMNNTLIHFFESYRGCAINNQSPRFIKLYRKYIKSLKIIIGNVITLLLNYLPFSTNNFLAYFLNLVPNVTDSTEYPPNGTCYNHCYPSKIIIIIQLLHTPSLNSVNYYYPRCGIIPQGRRPSGILPTPRVVIINTLFNKAIPI